LASDARVDVIGEAARLNITDPFEADVVVMSASFSDLEWIPPDLPSLLLLTDSPLSAAAALRSRPAFGLLPNDASGEVLLTAIHALAEGLTVGPRHFLFAEESADAIAPGPLTERELEVLNLLAQGLANKQIAATLRISEHTVKFHISSIYSKLKATNRAEAIRAGLRGGWIAL
jgi:DNA-binding NarL/FixJ family response regulator